MPPSYEGVEYPPNRKLKPFDKGPPIVYGARPLKHMKDVLDIRGPELVHNKLQYAEFGIQALGGGNLRHGHLDMVRNIINKKMDESRMFAIWRVEQPWKAKTKKAVGHTMGGGKGNIHHYILPIRAHRIIVEVGGECQFEEVYKFLHQAAHLLPFPARAVSRRMLQEEQVHEKELVEENVNPFTFEYCTKNNFLGCQSWLSPFDYKWHGKHR